MNELRRFAPALLALACLAAACSSSQDTSPTDASVDAPATDSGPDANTKDANEPKDGNAPDAKGDDAGDAGPCLGTLNQSGCATTYAAAQGQCADAGSLGPTAFASCGGLSAAVYDFSTHSKLCLYDGTGALVGAQTESDINEFCGASSYLVTAGNVPAACTYPWERTLEGAGSDAGVTHCAGSDGGPADAATKD